MACIPNDSAIMILPPSPFLLFCKIRVHPCSSVVKIPFGCGFPLCALCLLLRQFSVLAAAPLLRCLSFLLVIHASAAPAGWPAALEQMPLGAGISELNRTNCVPVLLSAF